SPGYIWELPLTSAADIDQVVSSESSPERSARAPVSSGFSPERSSTSAADLDQGVSSGSNPEPVRVPVSSGSGRELPARAPRLEAVPSPDKEVKAPEPGALPEVGRAIGREGELSERAEAVAAKEGTGIIEGTFNAFAEWVVQTFADAHGLGLLVRAAR